MAGVEPRMPALLCKSNNPRYEGLLSIRGTVVNKDLDLDGATKRAITAADTSVTYVHLPMLVGPTNRRAHK
jgi:hypothetical protein